MFDRVLNTPQLPALSQSLPDTVKYWKKQEQWHNMV